MKIKTNFPVAVDSLDHLYPWGTKYDNHSSPPLITEIENYFKRAGHPSQGKKISFLDIGCSGGQFAVDFHNRGHIAVGLEGSDYSVKNKRANWPAHYNNVLFTCDATKPYEILNSNGEKVMFDCISAWEVIEHIHPDCLDQFFLNISNHMKPTSIFLGSVSLVNDFHDGRGEFGKKVDLHRAVYTKEKWYNEILNKYFEVREYIFAHKVRNEATSFYVTLVKL